jgi:hypothetical protein
VSLPRPAPSKPLRTAVLALGLVAAPLAAEPPKLEALFPAGGRAGTNVDVAASGRVDDARLVSPTPGLQFVPTGKKREWQAHIEADTPGGLHLVYAVNSEGASAPRWFSVGTLPELNETESNNEAGKGMALEKLPVCVNARLDPGGDVDHFHVNLKAGQTLAGLVEGYALGSPVDILLHILDATGTRVCTASDGRNLDPDFVFTANKAGRHTIQVVGFVHPPQANVSFTGGSTTIYRLHLSAGPLVRHVQPAVVAATGRTALKLGGVALDAKTSTFSAEAPAGAQEGEVALLQPPNTLQPLQMRVSAAAPQAEKEPNQERDQATPIQPGTVAGLIATRGDTDRFALTLKKGDKLQASVWARRLGLPLDPALRIEDPAGKVLAEVADVGDEADPTLSWTAAVDGVHLIVISDQFQLGEPDAHYVLEVGPAMPGFEALLTDAKPITLERGKTASVKLTVKRLNGHKEPLVVRVAGLPAGVHAAEVAVPEKGGEVELKLQAAANAPASGAIVRLQVWSAGDSPRVQPVLAPLRGEDRRGTSLLDHAETLWLQVR